MTHEEIKFQILQTLINGNNVIIKDTPNKEHILGKNYATNLNVINHYIEQLDYDIIVVMIQEDANSDLFIETTCKLKTWGEDSIEYENLDILWNYLNWYLTDFGKNGGK